MYNSVKKLPNKVYPCAKTIISFDLQLCVKAIWLQTKLNISNILVSCIRGVTYSHCIKDVRKNYLWQWAKSSISRGRYYNIWIYIHLDLGQVIQSFFFVCYWKIKTKTGQKDNSKIKISWIMSNAWPISHPVHAKTLLQYNSMFGHSTLKLALLVLNT